MGIKRLLKTMISGCSLLLTSILFASNGTIGIDSDAETGLQVAADSPQSALDSSATLTGSATTTLPAICPTPFTADTRPTTVTVGSGTAASCTETALANALAKGGVIRFNCGGAATITLTSQKTLRTNVNTTLDGQGKITLDGRGTTRLLYYSSPNFQATKTVVTIQNLTLQNGAASGTPIPAAPAPCSQGTKNDGGGAAIYIRDGILRVWNTTFKNNEGATLGPDVGGGAIYSLGSLGTTIVGSTFQSNRAANGGAIGALFGDLSIYNSQFSSNQATGNPRGGALYFHNSNLVMTASTLSGNTASGGGGGLFADSSTLMFTNDTFVNNIAQHGLGGGIMLSGNGGTLQNVTFSGNQSTGGSGFFAAAIAGGTSLSISNTLFSENTTRDCYSPMACSAGGSTGLHNLQWPSTHAICANADHACTTGTVFSNPQLDVLENNGGPTQTAAPLPGSPALGIGRNCPATDQRGVARPLNGCTAGAVEGAIAP